MINNILRLKPSIILLQVSMVWASGSFAVLHDRQQFLHLNALSLAPLASPLPVALTWKQSKIHHSRPIPIAAQRFRLSRSNSASHDAVTDETQHHHRRGRPCVPLRTLTEPLLPPQSTPPAMKGTETRHRSIRHHAPLRRQLPTAVLRASLHPNDLHRASEDVVNPASCTGNLPFGSSPSFPAVRAAPP
jgi:hypothetical protein